MVKAEAEKELKRLRKGISTKWCSYKLVRVKGAKGGWGIQRTSVYIG